MLDELNFSLDTTLLLHCFLSVLLVLLAAICLGFFFSGIRNFAASHNPFGANLINYLTFPGVVHHELSHALFAFLTGAKVTEIKLFRIHHKDGRLGYVSYAPRGNFIMMSIQKVLSSVAPIVMGFVSCSLLYLYARPALEDSLWQTALLYYALVSIILHMSLSKQDIKVMKSGILVVILGMTIGFYVFGFNLIEILQLGDLLK